MADLDKIAEVALKHLWTGGFIRPDLTAMGAERGILPIISNALVEATAELEAENARLRKERDLAVAHDRQPYPTAEAYDLACKALNKHKAENARLTKGLKDAAHLALCFSHYNWCSEGNDCQQDCEQLARDMGDRLAGGIELFLKNSMPELWGAVHQVYEDTPQLKRCPYRAAAEAAGKENQP